MSIFQIIAFLFALIMIYAVTVHKRKIKLSNLEVSLWYSLWLFFIVIALFPNLLMGITSALRFSRVFDLLIVVAFMILTSLIISNYFAQKELQKKLESIVRGEAIKNARKK